MIMGGEKRELALKAKRFHDLFTTELGKEVLRDIESESGDGTQLMVKGDQHTTTYNVGKYDLYSYITKLIKIGSAVEVK